MVLEALVVLLQDPCSERLSLHVHLTRSARTSREVISCSKFLDQLKKFVDEAGSSSVVQLLPNLPSSVKKWEYWRISGGEIDNDLPQLQQTSVH